MDFQAEFLGLAEQRDLRALSDPDEDPGRALLALTGLLSHKKVAEEQGLERLSLRLESMVSNALAGDEFCALAAERLPMELAARLAPAPLRFLAFEDAFRSRLRDESPSLPHHLVIRVADCFIPLPPRSPGQASALDEGRAQEALDALSTALGVLPEDCVNWPDAFGNTPLHWAVCSLSLESVRMLLESGANPDFPNALGCTPFDPDFFEDFIKKAPQSPDPARAQEMRALIERHSLALTLDLDDSPEGGADGKGESGGAGEASDGRSGGSARRL